MEYFGLLLSIFAGFAFLIITFGLVLYVLNALALHTLAKNNGFEDKFFLAWIPVANQYLFGLLSGDANIFGKIEIEANILAILLAVGPFLLTIPVFGFVVMVCYFILYIYAKNNLYKKIDESNATIMTIVSVLFPVVSPIYLFIKRNTIFTNYTPYEEM